MRTMDLTFQLRCPNLHKTIAKSTPVIVTEIAVKKQDIQEVIEVSDSSIEAVVGLAHSTNQFGL